MAKRSRGVVEKVALVVIVGALGWLALNAGLAQLEKSSGEVVDTSGEPIRLQLEEGEQLALYAKEAETAFGPSDIDCQLVPADVEEADPVIPERSSGTRLVDGWNRYDRLWRYTAPTTGSYTLACQDSLSELLGPRDGDEIFQIDTTIDIHVTDAASGQGWVHPSRALAVTLSVIAVAGLTWVVASLFGGRPA